MNAITPTVPDVTVSVDTFELAERFSLSRGSKDVATVVTVLLSDGEATGRGECVPYARYGETVASVIDAINAVKPKLRTTTNGDALLSLMTAGAARNAVDCALWDYHAKKSGQPVWELIGCPAPMAVHTAFTLSLDSASAMAAKAAEKRDFPTLKLKLGAPGDEERIRRVRQAVPDAQLIIDANEGWSAEQYLSLLPVMLDADVAVIEQPFAATDDAILAELPKPITVCADESFHGADDLPTLNDRYSMVNVKLDKTGGLTSALAVKNAARLQGFEIMVGCMVASSLGLAPALLLAEQARSIDLDASLLLAEDRAPPLLASGAQLTLPAQGLWGTVQ